MMGQDEAKLWSPNQFLESARFELVSADYQKLNDRDFHLGCYGEPGLASEGTCEHDSIKQPSDGNHSEESVLAFDRDMDAKADENSANMDSHGNHLTDAGQNDEFVLLENHDLTSIEYSTFQDNLNQDANQNQAVCAVLEPPVLQSRIPISNPNHQLAVGQQFPDVHSCRRAIRDLAIAYRFEMQTIKSDKIRFTAKCASEGCPWRIHAAKLPDSPMFTIRTIHEEHTCGGISHLGHLQASVQWVADSVGQCLRENPHCKPKEILEAIHQVHGIALSYKQAWRAKERFAANIRGSFEEEYRLLPRYCDQVRVTNPGSIAVAYGNPQDNCFCRLFISFQACIYGFTNACRPLIGLYRTHLKSAYLGTLLLAAGFDGDGAVFPLAFGVVDDENDTNWMWFLSELHNLLETNGENMPKLTILSDRQKGIVDGIQVNFPTAFHGLCIHHLADNFRMLFSNTILCDLLWEAAHALTDIQFELKLLEMEEISQEAACWVRSIDPHLWATAYFEGIRLGNLTPNIVESLDPLITEASGLPIIQMMESIRQRLMVWFNTRHGTSMQWMNVLVPSAEKQVAEAIMQGHSHQVLKTNDDVFKVTSEEGEHMVDIRSRKCSCRGWQLSGLPCSHAVAALLSCRQNVYRFAESCFTVATYRKAYSQAIHPIPDKAHWEKLSAGLEQENSFGNVEHVINPPKSLQPPPGRPRKKRVHANDGVRMKRPVHCGRCKQTGHFRTTCTNPL